MKRVLIFFIFFNCYFSYAQQLEANIYTATEAFISNQNEVSLLALSKNEAEFRGKLTTRDEQLAFVFLLCNKAYYFKEHNKLKNAIAAYEDAWTRFGKFKLATLSDYDIIEFCLKPLGNLYTKTGDYTNAENIIKHYIFLAEQSNDITQQVGGAINLSKLYQSIGKHQTTINIIENILKYPDISPDQKQNLKNIKVSSLIILNKYNKVEEVKSGSTVPSLILFNQYKNAYQLALQKGSLTDAASYFNKAKEVLFKQRSISARDVSKLYVEEAHLFLQLNNPNNAIKSLQLAIHSLLPNFEGSKLPSEETLYAENTFIDIFDLYGDLQENSADAIISYKLSFYVASLLQESITSQEAKIINKARDRARSEKCINLLFNEYTHSHNVDFLVAAFQFAEQSKVSVLKEISQKKNLLQHYFNDSLLLKEQLLMQQQEYTTNQLLQAQLGGAKVSEIDGLSVELSAISVQLKAIKSEILKVYPQVKENRFSTENLKEKLQKDEASLIEYFYGNEAIYQFVVTAEEYGLKKILLDSNTRSAISMFIHFFDNATVINSNINEYTNQAYNMYKLLGFSNPLISKNAIIIPDGLLNFIPFEALLSANTETVSFSEMPFLVKEKNVTYNSSVLFYLKKSPIHNNNNKLLGVFPVFENTNETLTYSIEEANAIQNKMPSTILMNKEASKDDFIRNASSYGVLHLSTHASSGSFTIPASIEFYKEPMLLNELYSLNLNPKLVVLSACETGIGKLQKGEGAMSIARGFQYAGVQNILFSLWEINDLATSKIMNSFYENYSSNQSASISNRSSKIAYLQNEDISNIKKSPYYWGSFVYYGALTPASRSYYMYYYAIELVVLLIAIFLLWKYIKKGKKK